MKIETRTVGNVRILDCSGKLTMGDSTFVLRKKMDELLQSGPFNIILNLGDVGYIDSPGVGELVHLFTTVKGKGGVLKLLNLTKKIRQVLAIAKLLTVFESFDNEKAAVASFGENKSAASGG